MLYTATLFISALLLFWIQPLVAKRLLPALGGTPAVWNTCLLFFQTLLLGAYAYAHVASRLSLRVGMILQLVLLAAGASLLPPGIADATLYAAPDAAPVVWLAGVLLAAVGAPVFALGASAPLLQRWFAGTMHARAADPYFLYAASNAGSLLALLLFPFLFEPALDARRQSALWSIAYGALILLTAWCAMLARHAGGAAVRLTNSTAASTIDANGAAWRGRLRWLALSFVPSSLVSGVTTYITTDIAAVPLLWVLPLALYLLTFVLAFARRRPVSAERLARATAGAGVIVALVLMSGATEPVLFLVLVHLAFFVLAALALHTRLADSRPMPARLGEYYLWLAAGGALGGAFNAIVAPVVFDTTFEYPLAIVLACALLPLRAESRRTKRHGTRVDDTTLINDAADALDEAARTRGSWLHDLAWSASLGLLTAALAFVVMRIELGTLERVALAVGVPLFALNHLFTKSARRFAFGLAGVMLASSLLTLDAGTTLHRERSFYGALRVTHEADAHKLYHGSTLHGRQFTDAARACEPLSYYHREAPLGSVFAALDETARAEPMRVAVVGLGTGATGAYSRADQTWTFYELDPAVTRLARDTRFFTYLTNCTAAPHTVVTGDARLRLRDAPDAGHDLIVLDAFSSDAVPIHLLTREALALYLSKLAPDGWLALHVSNRTLDLHGVISRLAADAGVRALYANDPVHDPRAGREPSQWIVLARPEIDLSVLTARDRRWQPLPARPDAPLWRDDFSSIVSALRW